jgi:hypothetical protein
VTKPNDKIDLIGNFTDYSIIGTVSSEYTHLNYINTGLYGKITDTAKPPIRDCMNRLLGYKKDKN